MRKKKGGKGEPVNRTENRVDRSRERETGSSPGWHTHLLKILLQGLLGSIPSQGSRFHMPQLRVHMPQLRPSTNK